MRNWLSIMSSSADPPDDGPKILVFDPIIGKLSITDKPAEFENPIQTALPSEGFFGGNTIVSHKRDKLMLHPTSGNKRRIDVETMHISCKSDSYKPSHNYGGVIIYQYDGKSEWRTANDTHCKTGYIVIQDTESEMVKKWKDEPGRVHGAVYRSAFGESVDGDHVRPKRSLLDFLRELFGLKEAEPTHKTEVVGEGFAIRNGEFKINSHVFNNPKGSEYHDGLKSMSPLSVHCIRNVVEYWMTTGPGWVRQRNFEVKQLLEGFDFSTLKYY